MKNLEQLLRTDINEQLEKVTKGNSPWVWEQIQTPKGRMIMESIIIGKILDTGLVPASIIPQLETENG